MKKELADSLRHMQSHPTTGLPPNQQIISTQVETIFILDELKESIIKLNKTIEASDKQSEKLEVSNYRLQWAMLILTAIGTMIVAFPIVSSLINGIGFIANKFLNVELLSLYFMTILSGIISALLGFIFAFLFDKKLYGKKFIEKIKMRDSLDLIVRDKDGNIKEIRHQE